MTRFEEATKALRKINQDIAHGMRARTLRNYLKGIIVGFFIYRNAEKRIALNQEKREHLLRSMEPIVNEHLDALNEEVAIIKESNTCLSKQDEKQILNVFENTKMELNYLKSERVLEEKRLSLALAQIEKLADFIASYNTEFEKKRARQNLFRIRSDILQAESEFKSKYNGDLYFSKKELYDWKKRFLPLIQPIEEAIKKGAMDVDFRRAIEANLSYYQNGERLIEKRNVEFIEQEMTRFNELFESLESCPLTSEQRRAVVIDEASNLVVAGAGSGKTSTIVAKACYLIKKGLASPESVLLIAFNRDVALEMDKRIFSELGLKLKVKTFHSLGLEIIAEYAKEKPSISELATDRVKLPRQILEFIEKRMDDENFAKTVTEYFLYYFSPYKSIFEFNSYGEYVNYLRKYEIRSLKGDLVKSFEECDIANFLYINGVEYAYEKAYEIKTADTKHRQYKPDFFLPEHGLYIEHFGIDRNGKTASYISQEEYCNQMKWKRETHNENRTTLIETYSYEKQEGTLLSNLKKKLVERGVVFKPISSQHIFDDLNELGRVSPFALLLSTFLNLYKSSDKTLREIGKSVDKKDNRTKVFLEIFSKVYEDYTAYLKSNNEIDFNDMINEATSLVKQGKYTPSFTYILVDEFQDISQSRCRFLKALLNQDGSKLFCVGDDWQSIYRFTGSDISVMLNFEKTFGFSQKSFLQETFRFGEKLCDFSTKFILKNPNQIKKQVTSKRMENNPAVTIIDSPEEDTLEKILARIDQSKKGKETIFIIGRYNFLEPQNLGKIAKTYPDLSIEYVTAHSSKGLEADHAILLGLTSGEYGFPSQIADDPILGLVLEKEDTFPNAEERRLFYVAITRAKKHVYLCTDERRRTSEFVTEILQEGYETETSQDYCETRLCPICKTGQLVQRQGKFGTFHSCSNYPYCEYTPKECPKCLMGFLFRDETAYKCSKNDCSFAAHICPLCNDGYLVLRTSRHGQFYGCSNYPKCNYVLR